MFGFNMVTAMSRAVYPLCLTSVLYWLLQYGFARLVFQVVWNAALLVLFSKLCGMHGSINHGFNSIFSYRSTNFLPYDHISSWHGISLCYCAYKDKL